jgi:hypothetical protein
MRISTRITAAVAAASLCLALAALGNAGLALAETPGPAPATVTVRVLGPAPAYEALTPPTTVNTTTTPVTKDGGSCEGTSAAGALELATNGNWEGNWSAKYGDYEVISIDGRSFPFEEGAPANYYWSFWHDNQYAEVGVCEVTPEAGDQILFVPSCFGSSCPGGEAIPEILGIVAPASAEAGTPFAVTVSSYNAKGEPSPMAGATVGAGSVSAKTNAQGQAQLTFTAKGAYTLRATGDTGAPGEELEAIPGEAIVCVHSGDDGACGTPTPSSVQSIQPGGPVIPAPYTGPYALVAAITGIREGHHYPRANAPRVLSGTVSARSSVTSISLRLQRSYRGRCWSYDGARDRLVHTHCGKGGFFQIASGGDTFSYLLPSRLPAGRYVLDIEATDAAGNRTALARGSSRVVFYVE